MANVQISVIMPALNEEANIHDAITDTLESFKTFGLSGEVVVVNDGSSDKTRDIVEDIMKTTEHVRVINHDSPKGIGMSFWDGVDYANGDFITMLPGDNENFPKETLRYFKILESVDIVVPFVYNREVRSLFRNALSLLYRLIINFTFLVNFNYTNGTVLYKKSVLKNLDFRSAGFFFQTDILIRLVKNGYLFAEVPYKLRQRDSGESKAVSYPSLIQIIKGYLKLVKDCYYVKGKINHGDFVQDSLSQKRYKEL